MKPSLFLIIAAVASPAFVLIGLGTVAAFSLATVIGVAAMLSHDYGRHATYHLAPAHAKRAEVHALAA